MDRSLPRSANKHLQKIWDEKNKFIHLSKLKSIKSRIDQKSPCRYSHIKKNHKRDQQQEGNTNIERYTEIERENRILLEKMSQIIQTRSNSFSKISAKKSTSKKKISNRILNDNSFLVKRLRNQSSSYSQAKFQEERKGTEEVLHRISEYPFSLGNKKIPRTVSEKKKNTMGNIVFMKTVEIDAKKLDVEVYKNKKRLIILAFDVKDMYQLIFPWNEAQLLMGDQWSYDEIVRRLQFEGGSLVLVE